MRGELLAGSASLARLVSPVILKNKNRPHKVILDFKVIPFLAHITRDHRSTIVNAAQLNRSTGVLDVLDERLGLLDRGLKHPGLSVGQEVLLKFSELR